MPLPDGLSVVRAESTVTVVVVTPEPELTPTSADLQAAADAAAPIQDAEIQRSFIRAMALDRVIKRKP